MPVTIHLLGISPLTRYICSLYPYYTSLLIIYIFFRAFPIPFPFPPLSPCPFPFPFPPTGGKVGGKWAPSGISSYCPLPFPSFCPRFPPYGGKGLGKKGAWGLGKSGPPTGLPTGGKGEGKRVLLRLRPFRCCESATFG